VTFVGSTNNIVIDKSANSMTFQDASRMIFGTGSDLLIEHSGASTESRIWNYGGNLSIAQQVNDEDVDILSDDGSGGTASYFRADGSTGEAMLFHYGSEKLATKSTGIDVTGTVTDDGATHDGDVTFTGASYNVVWDKSDNQFEFATNAKIKFGLFTELYDNGAATFMVDQTPIMKVQYDTSGTGGPSFFLNHKKTTPADGDTSGNIYFSLEDVDTALITSTQPDVTTATSSGNLIFKVREDNSTVTYMTIDGEGENITMAKPLAVTGNVNVTGTVTDDGATHDGDVTFTGAN
jgi:hypothetical protein